MMISGLGSIQFKPTVGGADGAADFFQGGATGAAGASTGTSFADALSQAASSAIDKMHNAESVSAQALKGDADTRQVVDAVMSAQQSLQTAIAIRDKIVTAYLEISRMGI